MKRNFVVIFEVNNNTLFESIFDDTCIIGNGLYKLWLGGNKTSTTETISKKATALVNGHKGLNINIVDIIETV